MIRLGSPLRDPRSAYLLVGVAALLVYLNALPNRFAYDDVLIVQTNAALRSFATLPGALVAPYWPDANGLELGLWRPVATALYGLQWMAGGGSPLVFHSVNVVMHAVVSLLLVMLLLELMSVAAAFAAGLLFAVHPLHVEAVANIIGFAELVSAAAVLSACVLHVRSDSRSRWGVALGIAALYFVGFGAKESAVTLPGLIFVLDAVRGEITLRDLPAYVADRWRLYCAMAVVAAALLFSRFLVLGSVASPLAPMGADVLTEIPRIWTLGEIWMHYVRLWTFPMDLSADYSPGVIPISFGWGAGNTVGAMMALLVLGAAIACWRRPPMSAGVDTARAAGFGGVWFMIAISPVSNTLFLSGVLLAERTLYLPSVGLAAATGWLVVRMSRERPRGAWIALSLAVVLAGGRTWTRNPTWYDNPTMLARLIGENPQSGRSQWVLGDAMIIQGRFSDGLRSYRAAIDLLGTHYQLVAEIAMRLMQHGEYGSAETLATFAAQDRPEFPRAWSQLALIRAEYGDAPGTERFSRIALGLDERDPTRQHLLAWSLAAQGQFQEAAQVRAVALEQGRAAFWQSHMYEAYIARAAGDSVSAYAAVDSAWARARTDLARNAVDSVRVAEFGLESLLVPVDSMGLAPAR